MFTGRLAEPIQCGVQNAECGIKANGDAIRQGEGAAFEDFPLKTTFSKMQ